MESQISENISHKEVHQNNIKSLQSNDYFLDINNKIKEIRKEYFKYEVMYEDGSTYSGQIDSNERSGLGMIRFKNGCVLSGIFKNNDVERCDLLKIPYDVYKNYFSDHKMFCKFSDRYKLYWPIFYSGQFKDNKFSGNGKLSNFYGQSYEGSFENGFKDGFGVMTQEEYIFIGFFVKDKKQGKGIMLFGTNKVYGEWNNDILYQNTCTNIASNNYKKIVPYFIGIGKENNIHIHI